MEVKKKRPPGRTPDGTYQSGGIESLINDSHSTTTAAEMQAAILRLLRPGQENAVSLNDLCNITGWSNRAIRRVVHAARKQGIPILSDSQSGHYLPGDPSEVKRFCDSMFHRASEIAATAEAVRKAVGV